MNEPTGPSLVHDVTVKPTNAGTTAPAQVNPAVSPNPKQNKPAEAAKLSLKPKKHKKNEKVFGSADRETKEFIIDNLSMLLSTGVSVGEALDSIASELPKKNTKNAIMAMKAQIDDGVPFSKAIGQTRLFNPSVVALVEVGESSGRLPENLKVIAAQMHKTNLMAAKIKSAMLYPAFLIGLLFAVGTGVGVFLLPRLLNILNGLDVKVGLITRILIVAGTFMGHYGLVVAAAVVVLGTILGIMIKKVTAMRIGAEAVIYHIPGIKKLLFETEIARFGFILGTLLESGLPVVTALESLSGSMATFRYRRFAVKLCAKIEEGSSFADTFAIPEFKKLLPTTIRQLIISAEKSGNLAGSLTKIGTIYEDKADITARNLETLLEPIILVIIAVCVLMVALAVILPIYSLVGGINKT